MGLIVDMKTMGGTMDVQTMSFESCFFRVFHLTLVETYWYR